jgi:hypothetical protein
MPVVKNNEHSSDENVSEFRGVFISEGMTFTLKNLGFRIQGDEVIPNPVTVILSVDQAPVWLEIALSHFAECKKARELILSGNVDDKTSSSLKHMTDEYRAGMQAISAAAIAIDAFYANLKDYIDIPAATLSAWRKKGTARYKQVFEVIKIACGKAKLDQKILIQMLSDLYKFRDWAVHPAAEAKEAQYHPIFKVSTHWRCVAFRYENALAAVHIALIITHQTSKIAASTGNEKLVSYFEELQKRIDPLCSAWTELVPKYPIPPKQA